MTLTSYISSAGIYYEFTLFLISGVRWLTSVFLLPCIEIYILLVLVNHLSGEKRLGHLAELLSMLVGWSLKALLALVCGFHMVQGLISPAADAFRTMSVSRGIEAIPGVGDAGSSATELVLGSAMLIKNGIGAGGSGGTDSALQGATYQAGGDYAGILCAGGNSAACVG